MKHYNKPDDVTPFYYFWRLTLIFLGCYASVYLFLLQWGFVVEWMDDVKHQWRAVLTVAVLCGLWGIVYFWNKLRRK